jgi:hypothetical protein
VIGGVGVASLLASGVFFILRGSAISKLEGKCGPDGNHCPPELEPTYNSGKTYSLIAPIMLGVGVGAVGTAVVLLVAQKKSNPPPPAAGSLRIEPLFPVVAGAPAGAAISGSF